MRCLDLGSEYWDSLSIKMEIKNDHEGNTQGLDGWNSKLPVRSCPGTFSKLWRLAMLAVSNRCLKMEYPKIPRLTNKFPHQDCHKCRYGPVLSKPKPHAFFGASKNLGSAVPLRSTSCKVWPVRRNTPSCPSSSPWLQLPRPAETLSLHDLMFFWNFLKHQSRRLPKIWRQSWPLDWNLPASEYFL